MQNFKNKLRERLAQKNLNKLSIGAFAVKSVESFFEKKVKIEGYFKNNILFIKPNPSFAKTQIFIKKQQIIEKANKDLENFGYNQKIKDIITK